MVIVIDGCNKAGKSTLIRNVDKELSALGFNVRVQHWGPIDVDDRVYSPVLRCHSNDKDIITIWDRSWVSEYVYGTLLNRDRRLVDDPWLGEFLHRRALFGNGAGFILVPATEGLNNNLLDQTDAGYSDNAAEERKLFMKYCMRFKWRGMLNSYDEASLKANTQKIVQFVTANNCNNQYTQDMFVHPAHKHPRVLFIGSNAHCEEFPGQWLPFTAKWPLEFARLFGDAGLCASWCDYSVVDSAFINQFKYVVAADKNAHLKIDKCHIAPNTHVTKIYIPISEVYGYYAALEKMQELGNSLQYIRRLLEAEYAATTYL